MTNFDGPVHETPQQTFERTALATYREALEVLGESGPQVVEATSQLSAGFRSVLPSAARWLDCVGTTVFQHYIWKRAPDFCTPLCDVIALTAMSVKFTQDLCATPETKGILANGLAAVFRFSNCPVTRSDVEFIDSLATCPCDERLALLRLAHTAFYGRLKAAAQVNFSRILTSALNAAQKHHKPDTYLLSLSDRLGQESAPGSDPVLRLLEMIKSDGILTSRLESSATTN